MADKEATLKLTLKADGFRKGLTDAEKAAAKSGAEMGKGLSKGLSDAGKAGLDALKGSLSSLKSAVMGIAGIGGGLALADMAKRAIDGARQFRDLAFRIKAGTGEMQNWRDLQADAQRTALKFGHSTEEVGKSISDLYAAVGDTQFAKDASKIVAEFATGAHEPLETMTSLAGGLNEKFGITAKELPDVLASVVSLGNKGGVSVGDLADKIGIIGANARGAGLSGKKGFELLVGMLNIADNATGTLKKGIAGVTGIIEGITNETIKDPLQKTLGFDLAKAKKEGLAFDDILGRIIEKSGGKHEKLAGVFSGDALKVVTELAKTYDAAFASTQGSTKEKKTAAWQAYEAAIAEASKSAIDVKAIQEEAAKEMETPEKKIATALEKLAQTFTNEKFTAAFEQLGDFIPKVIEQITKHPILTGALLSGVPQAIIGSFGKSLTDALGSLLPKGAGAAGGIAATAALVTGAGIALIDHTIEKREANDARSRGAGASAGDMVVNSRTMRGDQKEFAEMAKQSEALRASLESRVTQARAYSFGGGASSDDVVRKQFGIEAGKYSKSGFSQDDFFEASAKVNEQMLADARNLSTLERALQDSTQATLNFQGRAQGTYGQLSTSRDLMTQSGFNAGGASDVVGMTLHGASDEAFGVGLGGPVKTSKQRAAEAAQEKEAARIAAQKQDFQGLAQGIGDAVGSKTLSVNIVESIPLKTDGGKPGKGSTPVE